ncbi:hypothetical protein FIBSPDRAFT_743008 [Athelia psychrophila]|uniref:F-box domain-containing protein n=1 Tax=Athelia psychrophila TaxID=1759441 RepID=A0A166IKY5_9AGAM|nr:hypothetical protein FIBSPDRAFT_743008 [Fibularhizoctonia sp. CBS 109695]
MGKVTVYCGISGCSPEMHRSLWFYHLLISDGGDEVKTGPIVRAALLSLIDDREKRSQDDVTLIGPPDDPDDPESDMDDTAKPNAAEVSAITDESLLMYRCIVDGGEWDFGFVDPESWDGYYVVSGGPIVMVQTSALSILLHATFGRMSACRFWRLMMVAIRTNRSLYASTSNDIIPGIDYGALMRENHAWEQDPSGTICMSEEEVANLESLGDEEQVRQAILNQGHFWVWLSPDRFPLQSNSRIDSCPILVDAASSSLTSAHKLSLIEHIPQKLLLLISSHLPLPTFLSFASVSRRLRYKLLGTDLDRDAFARGWITNNAPWYLPLPLHPSLKGAWKLSDYREQEDEDFTLPNSDIADWNYLRRCLSDGSMRNRKRIWNVAEQLEKKAEELPLSGNGSPMFGNYFYE